MGRRGRAVHGLLTEGLCLQFQKLGSREAVRSRVLEVVNHVDKVLAGGFYPGDEGGVREGGLPEAPPPAGASRTQSNTGQFWPRGHAA